MAPFPEIEHHVQTNATLIDDAWCEFFLQHQVEVGVSVDGRNEAGNVQEFADEFGVTFRIWHDPEDRVGTRFRTVGVPTTFLLDRDGVINRDSQDFIKSPSEWVPIDGSLEAIARLTQNGFTVAVASNQSGIGRGLYDRATLAAIHRKMRRAAAAAGGAIDRIVFCPHRPEDGCECRKPAPGLLRRLGEHYGMALRGVPVIGDSLRDLEAARFDGRDGLHAECDMVQD